MTQLTIITGKQNSGKSTLARKMTEGKKTFIVNSTIGNGNMADLEQDTEFILLDEYQNDMQSMKRITSWILENEIRIRQPYHENAESFKTPHFIICSQTCVKVPEAIKSLTELINL